MNLRSVRCCWFDSWSIICISESISPCFNFSKTGYDEWLSQYFVWTDERLINLDEFGEVKGKNILLPLFFSCLWEELRNWKCWVWEKGNYSIRDWYLCSNLVCGLLLESLIKIWDDVSLLDSHTWTIVTVKKNS